MLELTVFNVLAVSAASVAGLLLFAIVLGKMIQRASPPLDVRFIISVEFGGGWAFAETDAGRDALMWFYGEPACELYPFGGEAGYVVDPQDVEPLIEHLRGEGVRWCVS